MLSPLVLGASALLAASPVLGDYPTTPSPNPVINLGAAGSYQGVIQNNGTVLSWKGIPYAQPPVGSLRFMPPQPLAAQGSSVVDVTTDALRCVQFAGAPYGVINGNIVGARSGPGQEDCLKLWIWKPANATAAANLPVMFYIHGGGLQFSAAPNNDFSDWVSQSQDFIAVNVGYRLGTLGFMAHPSLPSANAGLLDHRLALQWVQKNVAAFGGNPKEVTIMGQSGGGYGVIGQMALYDGDSQGLFNKAVPRSIQRSPMFTVAELADRNAQFAKLLGCPASQAQLDCFQQASVPALVNATTALSSYVYPDGIFKGLTTGGGPGFLPAIDGKTLTASLTTLFKTGKIARNIKILAGFVNDEGAASAPRNISALTPATNGIWNISDALVNQATTDYYPINATFGSASPEKFFLTTFKAYITGLNTFGDAGITGSERLLGRYGAKAVGPANVWTFRFGAPGVGTSYNGTSYPLAYVAHSADNSYLQNATAVMTPFEKSLALEWRAYVGSFIRKGDPNAQKLGSAPWWGNYGGCGGDYVGSPMRMVPRFAYVAADGATGSQMEVVQKAQIERVDWWQSDALLRSTRL